MKMNDSCQKERQVKRKKERKVERKEERKNR